MAKDKVYDSVGVILSSGRGGKWKAFRIGVNEGKVEILGMLTDNRSMSAAHRVGLASFELLITDLTRGNLFVSEPEQTSFKFDQS